MEPSSETAALYGDIRAGAYEQAVKPSPDVLAHLLEGATVAALPVVASPVRDWGDMRDVLTLYGRQAELAHLTQWFHSIASRPRVTKPAPDD